MSEEKDCPLRKEVAWLMLRVEQVHGDLVAYMHRRKQPKTRIDDWYEVNEGLVIEHYDNRIKRIAKCSCGHEYEFYSQIDNAPEYYTTINMRCPHCPKYIAMEFPVN